MSHYARGYMADSEDACEALQATKFNLIGNDVTDLLNEDQAEQIAKELLATVLPQRWVHVQAVAHKAAELGVVLFGTTDARILVSAAWLHDIGYAPEIAITGFHPLDGADWLRRRGVDARICALVANHSCAIVEAEDRIMSAAMFPFPPEQSLLADALTFADMTTGPLGQSFDVAARVAEIKSRYGAGHAVSRFIVRAEPLLLKISDRVLAALHAEAQARK